MKTGNLANIVEKHQIRILGSGGRTFVLASGLGLDQSTWRLVAPSLAQDNTVVLFDYVGFGKSNRASFDKNHYQNLEAFAEDVMLLCDTLQLKDVVFVGHSISSMIGLIAGLRQPERFDKFIFIGPSPCYLNDNDGYVGGLRREDVDVILKEMEDDYLSWVLKYVPGFADESNARDLVQEIIQTFVSNDPATVRQFALAAFFADYRRELLDFDKECLILQTRNDALVPVQVGDYLRAHLSRGTLIRLSGQGHFPQLTSAAEVLSAMRKFLQDH